MFAFLKRFFSPSEKAETVRRLTHPQQLQTGDILKFRFSNLPDISGKEFEVSTVNSYIYGDIGYSECVLKDRDNNLLYLMVEEEDGEEYLALSKKIDKSDLVKFISPSDLEAIKTKGLGTQVTCSVDALKDMERWVTKSYEVVDADIKGSFVKGDIRFMQETEMQKREHFSSYLLECNDYEDAAIEIEIYSTGEIEACATAYLEFSDIEEMWPATVTL